jgi:hypothetical protein
MTDASTGSDDFDAAAGEIPSCSLDEVGKREQRARYALLAGSVTRLERQPATVSIHFDRDVDRPTLEQALGVERECCPFLRLAFDQRRRRLRATVADVDHVPALDAIADALEPSRRRDSGC